MSEERDALLPQLEELRWRNRQADKELQQLREAAEAAQQVCFLGIYDLHDASSAHQCPKSKVILTVT